jgi:glycerate 2-kinase
VRILIAPDSFKGTNSSVRVAELIERGVRSVFPDAAILRVPVADGGEGTVEAVVTASGGEYRRTVVTGPLGEPVEATWGVLPGGRAVIEMAEASGLPLVPADRRNPEITTTYGTGELISAALESGCSELLIGIGGSATTDAGVGMAEALGYRFLTADGSAAARGGGALATIERIDRSRVEPSLSRCRISVACDVRNPLYGPEGAAAVYGPQKGADEAMVARLDDGLAHIAIVIELDLGRAVAKLPGAGAAGGLGAGLVAFCHAELRSGIDAMLDIVRFDSLLRGVDLVITGEGAMDGSTSYGKVPVGVAKRAKAAGVPVLALVGNIGKGAERVYEHGIDGIMTTVDGAMPLEVALEHSSRHLEEAAGRLMRFVRVGMRLPR